MGCSSALNPNYGLRLLIRHTVMTVRQIVVGQLIIEDLDQLVIVTAVGQPVK